LVLSLDGQHLIVRADGVGGGYHLDTLQPFLGFELTGKIVASTPGGYVAGAAESDWNGVARTFFPTFGSSWLELAQHVHFGNVMSVVGHPYMRERPYLATSVQWSDYSYDHMLRSHGVLRDFRGVATAAFGDDDRAVLAFPDGRFFALARRSINDVEATVITLAETQLGFYPYELSIIEPNTALLSPDPPPATPPDVDALPSAGGAPGAILHLLDPQAQELWRVHIPFAVHQPPIRGNDGVIFVVGNGVAAVKDGKLLWQLPLAGQLRATSTANGRLLVSAGDRLLLVSEKGKGLHSAVVRPGEVITSSPSIHESGFIYVATQQAIYRANILPR
jgi:hypothetical protein